LNGVKNSPQYFGDALLRPVWQTDLRGRAAMTLFEVSAAAAMLAVLMTISVQMLRAVGDQQRATEQRAMALTTIQALSEQIGNIPWDELTTEAVSKIEIPAEVAPHLPQAKLSVAIHYEHEPVAAKRVAISLEWKRPNGRVTAPTRLTTWAFPDDLPGS
jgi:hypothetical protein